VPTLHRSTLLLAVTGFDPRPSGRTISAWAPLPRGGVLAGGFFSGTEFRATSGLARFRGR
jgi:hypothetical protein